MYRPQQKKNFWDCYSFDKEPEYVPYQRKQLPQQFVNFQPTSIIQPGVMQASYPPQQFIQQSLPMQQIPMQQAQMQPLQSSIQYMQAQPMQMISQQQGIPQMSPYGSRYY